MILLIQELQEKYDLLDENLNSIMILLILQIFHQVMFQSLHLNSIMILLILLLTYQTDAVFSPFKFHYDSINSATFRIMKELPIFI